MQAKDSFVVRKVSLTKAVFMALLKHQDRWSHVLEPDIDQPYADGTVFLVHNFRKLCCILMRAYALATAPGPPEALLSGAGKIQADANEIMCFLDRAQAVGTKKTRLVGVSSRSCKPWLCLRNSIKEANVQPMALVARNAGLADKCDRADWYARKEWFMALSIMPPGRTTDRSKGDESVGDAGRGDDNDSGSSTEEASDSDHDEDGTNNNNNNNNNDDGGSSPCNLWGFQRWGEQQQEEDGRTDYVVRGKMRRGKRAAAGPSDPDESPPLPSSSSAAQALLMGLDHARQSGNVAKQLRRKGVVKKAARHTKRMASPFDPVVVEIVRRALREEEEDERECGSRFFGVN